jgi:hypothetical protein
MLAVNVTDAPVLGKKISAALETSPAATPA